MTRVARLARGTAPLIAAAILSMAILGAGAAIAAGAEPPAGPAGPNAPPNARTAGPEPPAAPSSTAAPNPAAAAGAPNPAPAATTTKPSKPTPPNLEPLTARADTGILGKKIMGPDGKELGLLVDVLVDAQGHPQAAVIDFGGFLGVGSRKIAVDWRLLTLSPGQPDWKISLNLGRDEIQAAPEYKPDEISGMMVGPPKAAPSSPDAGK
jgi:PRC-barrel domain